MRASAVAFKLPEENIFELLDQVYVLKSAVNENKFGIKATTTPVQPETGEKIVSISSRATEGTEETHSASHQRTSTLETIVRTFLLEFCISLFKKILNLKLPI